jgi:hypothetical protein
MKTLKELGYELHGVYPDGEGGEIKQYFSINKSVRVYENKIEASMLDELGYNTNEAVELTFEELSLFMERA